MHSRITASGNKSSRPSLDGSNLLLHVERAKQLSRADAARVFATIRADYHGSCVNFRLIASIFRLQLVEI